MIIVAKTNYSAGFNYYNSVHIAQIVSRAINNAKTSSLRQGWILPTRPDINLLCVIIVGLKRTIQLVSTITLLNSTYCWILPTRPEINLLCVIIVGLKRTIQLVSTITLLISTYCWILPTQPDINLLCVIIVDLKRTIQLVSFITAACISCKL